VESGIRGWCKDGIIGDVGKGMMGGRLNPDEVSVWE